MSSLLKFITNLLLMLLALLFGVWVEGFAYWYVPDAFFLLATWLLFIRQRLDFLALALVSLLVDIYLGNHFGSYLLALSLMLYFLGVLGFGNYASSPVAGSLGVFFAYLLVEQIMLFANLGLSGLLEQQPLLSLSKALACALAWLVLIQFSHSRRYELADI